MEKMSHDPIAADIGTQVSDNALHGVTAGSTALTSVTGLVPAGREEDDEDDWDEEDDW